MLKTNVEVNATFQMDKSKILAKNNKALINNYLNNKNQFVKQTNFLVFCYCKIC